MTATSTLIFPAWSKQAAGDTMLSQAFAPEQTEEAERDNLASEIVQIQNRLWQQEYSLQFIQGEVANLSNKVAHIGSSLGMHIQDGTSHYQASSFGMHLDVQCRDMPIYDGNGEETKGHSSENKTPPPMSATTSDQMQFQAFRRMPVFDVYDGDRDGCSPGFVDVLSDLAEQELYEEEQWENEQPTKCLSKPVFSLARPSVGLFSEHASEHAADVSSIDVPHFLVEESSDITNSNAKLNSLPDSELGKKVGQAATQLWNKLLTEAGRQEWDPGIAKPYSMDLWLYWHQNIKFNGIAIWLITFNPP
jgi:hypothetical protein